MDESATSEADSSTNLHAANLHNFLSELESEGFHFELATYTPGAVMVQVTLPRERWEIDFYADGRIHADRFVADGDPGKPLRDFWKAASRFMDVPDSLR